MPVMYQKYISREDLKANPNILYVFGDNLLREGFGGQAKEMRGEPNAVGFVTKKKPTMEDDAFFSDDDHESLWSIIEQDVNRLLEHLEKDGIVVLPFDGLGTGLSMLPEKAPKIHRSICAVFVEMRRMFPA